MRYRVRFHAAAQQDIAELLTELAPKAGVDTALKFVGRIVDYCLSFETFPERGARHDEIAHGLRTVGWRRRATIAFEVAGDTVIILRVLYAGRTLKLPDEE
ncbi:type II toxin-antitoxin system RelE/ParE family toxin [Mesorhizobium sp. VK22B]|uniref:Type II toxin-antitoxin system RelE/ParE family toxin n=1 Tax=Mesorhizobium captivum TaxID=3072319 RepID=A0ABU4Z483_9HYPH|nr:MULTISPECIES: type II toxin-antitoxin system RelE/ParE family toxin [unclassified Mesorhizobium]MDX8493833.1 type II toxin-antitoxin system RelE/ParE family toxin [Mesorhizobium sp. VK22B]MDX8507138.1 type II toxin-antitoxin system RelE/ParE family toxin [Mesorhizobium sp. VK22E]